LLNERNRRGERLQEGQFGTFIGRYRAEYADEKQLQSDGNMPSLPEQERTRCRREPMKTDFSQKAACRAAAIDAVHSSGKRIEADSARRTPITFLNGPVGNHDNQIAGQA
jgi:hypothetical protein